MAEFDTHSADYQSKLAASLGLPESSVDQFAAYKIEKIAELEPNARNGNFLDFGCGIGLSRPHIQRLFPDMNLFMADQSSESLSSLTNRIADSVSTIHVEASIPLDEESISIALASCVFHHIEPDDRLHWLKEIKRVLLPGSALYIFEHNPFNPLTQLIVRRSPLDMNAQLLSCAKTISLCREAGFSAIYHEYLSVTPPSWKINSSLDKLFKRIPFGTQFVVRAIAK